MNQIKRLEFLTGIMLIIFILSACSGTPPATTEKAVTEILEEMPTETTMVMDSEMDTHKGEGSNTMDEPVMESRDEDNKPVMSQDSEGMDDQEEEMMSSGPAFLSATLTDAATSEEFTFSDFKGKVVLVETMAMWCSNCFKQQNQVKALHDLVGENADLISVGLDIDINENLEDLKDYVANNGFNWLYGVATQDVAREISLELGDQFLNPPSTPMFIIDREGQIHPLKFGIKSAEELLHSLQPFLENGSN